MKPKPLTKDDRKLFLGTKKETYLFEEHHIILALKLLKEKYSSYPPKAMMYSWNDILMAFPAFREELQK